MCPNKKSLKLKKPHIIWGFGAVTSTGFKPVTFWAVIRLNIIDYQLVIKVFVEIVAFLLLFTSKIVRHSKEKANGYTYNGEPFTYGIENFKVQFFFFYGKLQFVLRI